MTRYSVCLPVDMAHIKKKREREKRMEIFRYGNTGHSNWNGAKKKYEKINLVFHGPGKW